MHKSQMIRLCFRIMGLLTLVSMLLACSPRQEVASVVMLSDQAIAANPTQAVIYVTPTMAPSAIPTSIPFVPTATPTPTIVPSETPDLVALQSQCDAILRQTYQTAGELCLGGPSGYFCNGGSPLSAEPAEILRSMRAPGSLVEANGISWVHNAPLLDPNGGGVMWLHLEENIRMNGMMLGNVLIRDEASAENGLLPWQSFTVVTTHPEAILCDTVPRSAFIVQGPYGVASRLLINGTAIDLNGTLVVQTDGLETHYIQIEGEARLTVLGQTRQMYAGQQMSARYPDESFTRPNQVSFEPGPLNTSLIANIPVYILDRLVQLPQPGFARTEGRVNMRSAPDIESRLLYAVPAGEILSVLGYNEARNWYHIRLGNGETGWMRSDLLASAVGSIEVAYDATPIPPQRLGDLATRAQVVAGTGGNLRSAPDVSFRVLATLPPGTVVRLLARSPYSPWVKVDADGMEGWMALITIETRAAIGFLPVDYDVPLPPRPIAAPDFSFGGGHAYPDPRGGS